METLFFFFFLSLAWMQCIVWNDAQLLTTRNGIACTDGRKTLLSVTARSAWKCQGPSGLKTLKSWSVCCLKRHKLICVQQWSTLDLLDIFLRSCTLFFFFFVPHSNKQSSFSCHHAVVPGAAYVRAQTAEANSPPSKLYINDWIHFQNY